MEGFWTGRTRWYLGIFIATVVVLYVVGINNLIWSAVGHVFLFAFIGIGVHILDQMWLWFLKTDRRRFWSAVLIAALYMVWGASGGEWLKHVILMPLDVLILMCAFMLGALIWQRRAELQKGLDDVVAGKTSPLAAAKTVGAAAASAVGDSAKGGFDKTMEQAGRATGR